MKLIYWPTCPYACKVIALLKATELESQVEKVTLHPWESDLKIGEHNPLHKVPVLITTKGQTLFDSRVICEYLDRQHKVKRLFPPVGEARWMALRQQSLADGILDAATAKLIEENVRDPALRSQKWVSRQNQIIRKSLDTLEHECASFGKPLTIGLLSIATAISYLSYRYEVPSWRAMHPRLATWYFSIIENPLYAATVPQETQKVPNDLMRLNT